MQSQNSHTEVFRESYGEIGRIRSSLGCNVPCLTLTATAATKMTRWGICENLGMNNCKEVMMDLNKSNIRYSVMNVGNDHRKNFQWLLDELSLKGVNTDRHIIFCHRADDMIKLFRFFSTSLGDKQYHTLSNNLPKDYNLRLFAMYHQKTDADIQTTVRQSFTDINGTIRVLFCTSAFGMGVDVKGVYTVIHYGPAIDIDDYLQESELAGRNPVIKSHALLLNVKGSSRGSQISKGIRQYLKDNAECKRVQLLKELQDNPQTLSVLHDCSSVCAAKCKCVCRSTCTCDPCFKNQSKAEIKIIHVYSQGELDSSDDEQETNSVHPQLGIWGDLGITSDDSCDSDQDGFTRKPVLYSSSSDEN